ncbi:MAG: hypothetical protein P8M78_17985 [Myxococcota bacterium]|nr:hypothetical protein [Myxococcota bacterium]
MRVKSSNRPRPTKAVGWACWIAILLIHPAPVAKAEAAVSQLAWRHPNPAQVDRFEILMAFSPEEKLNPAPVSVGKPVEGDHFAWGVTLDDQTSVWVAVVAVGLDGQVSSPSAWRRIDWQPGQAPLRPPGRPYLVDPRR